MTPPIILFDWDGCLAKTMHVLLQTFQEQLARHGILVTRSEIRKNIFGNWITGLQRLGIVDTDAVIEEISLALQAKLTRVDLYPDVPQTLITLANQGKKLVILSDTNPEQIKSRLENLGLSKNIYRIYPKDLAAAVTNLGADPADCLWVGNSYKDWEMGQGAGVETIIFTPPENAEFFEQVQNGMQMITKMTQLLK